MDCIDLQKATSGILFPLITLLYNTGIFFYGLVLRIAANWHPKAKQWVEGRKGLMVQYVKACDPNVKKIWMHCPSLGEFEQGRPVIEALKKLYPNYPVVLTFFSPSGYENQKNYTGAEHVFYLPEDSAAHAHELVRVVNPALALFVKYDFWLHYLQTLQSSDCTTLLISGIFRPDQHFFGSFPQLGKRMLNSFDHLFVQNQESLDLLQQAGYSNATLSGDTRFDRVKMLAEQAEALPLIEQFAGNRFTVVCGSTWPADEKHLFPVINQHSDVRWIIAPHEITEKHLADIESQLRVSSVRLSQTSEEEIKSFAVLIIDNIGLLSRIYRYGKLAYVGGGFGKSIHNILEAAAWGVPTLFGPRHEKFDEAHALIHRGGAFVVNSTLDIDLFLKKMRSDHAEFNRAQAAARDYVMENAGATPIITRWISSHWPISK